MHVFWVMDVEPFGLLAITLAGVIIRDISTLFLYVLSWGAPSNVMVKDEGPYGYRPS